MLPIYMDISNKAKKIINKNIWYMFDLFFTVCEGGSYEEMLDSIFPSYILENQLDKCVKAVKDVANMAVDEYEREYIKPFYEWTLYHIILWWEEVAEDIELDEVPEEICLQEDGRNLYKTLNDVDNYLDFMFADWDFLDVGKIYSLYKRNPCILTKFLHIDISQYIELMPEDIQEEYEELKQIKIKASKIDERQEDFIVNSIYSYLQIEETRAKRYEKCSEVDLSDNIRNALFQLFKEHELDIEREARGGYAIEDLGELDFHIYSYKKDIYKRIAVGENKKWGQYKKSIGQLLGYMDSNTKFGFTIIYNTDTRLKTVLDRRKIILQDFNIEGNFRVVGEIEELKEMKNVLRTCHENPEKAGENFYLYHFVFNVYKPDWKEAASVSRERVKNKRKVDK